MSRPDGYREQDGCMNCVHCFDGTEPHEEMSLDCVYPAFWKDVGVRRPLTFDHVDPHGTCPKWERS
jgi:hypothetical protein